MNNNFGIIQGRLTNAPKNVLQSFPKNWQKEFLIARNLKFKFIELISERKHNFKNPIWDIKGRNQIKKITKKNNIQIYSLCDDYFIDNYLFDKKSKKIDNHLDRILEIVVDLKCKVLILPFLEKNDLRKRKYDFYVNFIKDLAIEYKKHNITLCLESLIDAYGLNKILNKINLDNVKCVFDTGNRINLNRNIKSEIFLLNQSIYHVHIKDKDLKNQNVLLGTGNLNLKEIFETFRDINYLGPYVFETTRGKDPIKTAKYNIDTCKFFLQEINS
tara:strand:+ start:3098 stop:3916 length:819 start_codon:yes stop_codon:yes gene_type:complete